MGMSRDVLATVGFESQEGNGETFAEEHGPIDVSDDSKACTSPRCPTA